MMKSRLLSGFVVLSGILGWCEEPAPVVGNPPVAETTERATTLEKKDVASPGEASTPSDSASMDKSIPSVTKDSGTNATVADSSSPTPTTMTPTTAPSARQTPPEEKPVGRVALIQKLVDFHEKESASAREMIQRWNVTLSPHINRLKELGNELGEKRAKSKTLENERTKAARKEMKMLKKEMSGIQKLIQTVQKDIANQYKSMGNEIKLKSGLTEKSLQETVRSVISGLQTPMKPTKEDSLEK